VVTRQLIIWHSELLQASG